MFDGKYNDLLDSPGVRFTALAVVLTAWVAVAVALLAAA